MHNFKDLRGGQSDTGDEQTLVVWTTVGKSLDGITSQLGEISNSLPYEQVRSRSSCDPNYLILTLLGMPLLICIFQVLLTQKVILYYQCGEICLQENSA